MKILPVYAAIFALLFVYLSVQTVRQRQRLRISVGDGGNPAMLRTMRVQGNFAEYVPLALLLIALFEMQAAPAWAVHALCVLLLCARVLHAYGVRQNPENLRLRVAAMMGTFSVLVGTALGLLAQGVLRALA
jgi:uncharacterized protein